MIPVLHCANVKLVIPVSHCALKNFALRTLDKFRISGSILGVLGQKARLTVRNSGLNVQGYCVQS